MLHLCSFRDAFYGLEQPKGSLFYKHTCVSRALTNTNAHKLNTYLGGYGHPSLKPLEIYFSFPTTMSGPICVTMGAAIRRVQAHPDKKPLAKRVGKWTEGDKKCLRVSQTYPLEFCKAIAEIAVNLQNCAGG